MAQRPEGKPKQQAKMLGIPLDELLQKTAEGLKRCTKCKDWKPISGFGKDRTRGDRLNPTCIGCKRVKEKKVLKGRLSNFKGRKHSVASRQQMSASQVGNTNHLGKCHNEETKQKLREVHRRISPRGSASHSWKGGTAEQRKRDQIGFKYREWRRLVFERDGYICQHCGDDRGGNLHAHHIQPWSKFPELRYELDNGLTLCRECHEKIHLKPIPTHTDIKRRKKHGSQ
ncbi:MAG: hypothetical protein DCF22_00575 [Leptolyngbya sp.]|nr:MAG: hypothetical protein DCF22_00575 [Leptolyngbya sp.]